MGMGPEEEREVYEAREDEHRQESQSQEHAGYSDEPREPKRKWWQFLRKPRVKN
jgi:hypothetical protein